MAGLGWAGLGWAGLDCIEFGLNSIVFLQGWGWLLLRLGSFKEMYSSRNCLRGFCLSWLVPTQSALLVLARALAAPKTRLADHVDKTTSSQKSSSTKSGYIFPIGAKLITTANL